MYNYRLCFLQCDLQMENSPQKAINVNVNEAQGIGRTSPDPLLSGWDLSTRLAWEEGWYNAMIQTRSKAWDTRYTAPSGSTNDSTPHLASRTAP